MPNTAALREIIPVLRQLHQAERFYMAKWVSGTVNPNAADWTECGTQFCMAGAKAAFDGWVPQYEFGMVWDDKLNGYERQTIATGMMVRPEHQADSHDPDDDEAHDPGDLAREAFDLDPEQVQFLFMATHISRVDDMVRRIEWLIDGDSPNDFPEEWEDEEKAHAEEDGYDHA